MQQNASQKALFLQWPNGTVMHCDAFDVGTKIQTFWDYRNPAVSEFWIEKLLNPVIASNQVDGVLFDDVSGLPNEHDDVRKRFNPQEINEIKAATFSAIARFTHLLASHGKYSLVYEGMDPTDQELSRFVFIQAPMNTSCDARMRLCLF